MAAKAEPGKRERSLIGAVLGVLVSLGIFLGLSVRACLGDGRLDYILPLALFGLVVGFFITIPAIAVGALIGYFARLKILLILGSGLLVVAFAIGYSLARDGCFFP